jgi:hypothetical protein
MLDQNQTSQMSPQCNMLLSLFERDEAVRFLASG